MRGIIIVLERVFQTLSATRLKIAKVTILYRSFSRLYHNAERQFYILALVESNSLKQYFGEMKAKGIVTRRVKTPSKIGMAW